MSQRPAAAGMTAIALLLLPVPALAQAPAAPPIPPERPADLIPPPPPGEPLRAPPVPPERPPTLGAAPEAAPPPPEAGTETPLPPARPPELSGAAALALKVAPPDDTACRVRLKRLGATFEPLPAIANGQCGAPRPLKVTALDGVALPQAATLTCTAAEALARWTTEVQSAADDILGKPLRAVTIGTSYECRGQNHDVDAKLSEHAFANGIDVMGFAFEGRAAVTVTGQAAGSAEARFLDAVRARACDVFRTVLGPGSDPAHANHLHLDERVRSAGHRLCQ